MPVADGLSEAQPRCHLFLYRQCNPAATPRLHLNAYASAGHLPGHREAQVGRPLNIGAVIQTNAGIPQQTKGKISV